VNTLADLFYQLEQEARPDLLMVRRGEGFVSVGAGEFADRVRRCVAALASLGIERGDRVGLICSNRPAWHVIDFACHLRGAILVPLFSTLAAAQVRYIFADSGCKLVFAEGAEQLHKVASVRAELVALEHLILVRAPPPVGESAPTPSASPRSAGPPPAETPGSSAALLELADGELEDLIARHQPQADCPGPEGGDAVATIIYTSGTTGEPKGVMLTHDNLISNMRGARQAFSCRAEDRAMSVLPLCHSFQRMVDYTFFYAGAQVAYASPLRLAEEYVLVRPTVVPGVPRLFERFRAAVLQRVASESPLKQRVFHWAEGVGRRRAEHELLGSPWTPLDRLRFLVADRLVLSKVRAGTGGRIHHFVSGGAALDPSLNWWFESMGLRVLQAYGLTETSPLISANSHDANRVGTVGTPIRDVEVKIAEDGEILTRGPHVMKGYWNQPQATAEMIVDGWLFTGDIGSLEDGYLRVVDRKKHLLVTSTGKNVAPQPLESALAMSNYVEQVSVVGDGRRFIAALIVPDFAILAQWAAGTGKGDDPNALCADPDVIDLIQREIDALQVDFATFEQVRAFRLLPTPFSIEDGTLTPTFKAVRKAVESKYAAVIEELYREDATG